MAKNLKLTVKNTQLAEALKKSKLKKEENAQPKEKAKEKPKAAAKPIIPAESESQAVTAVPKEPIEAAQEPVEAAPPKVEEKKAPLPSENVEKPKAKHHAYEKHKPHKHIEAHPPKTKHAPPLKKPENEEDKSTIKDIKKKDSERTFKDEKKQEGYRAEFSRVTRDVKSNRFDSRDRHGLRVGEERTYRRRRPRFRPANKEPIEIVRPKNLSVRIPISIKDLAQAMKLKASELISKLFMQGVALTLNDYLDDETTIQLLGHEFECEITIDTSEEERLRITDKTIQEEIADADEKHLEFRAPIVAFMGHVDHGKTSLIDAIRKSNIAGGEAGAITQHIGAFKCHREHGDITILDTPGHEAFSMMRMRGATITDIVVLVIAGDEGIMPQTDEAIKHAKEQNVPMVIAINKCDKVGFDADTIYRQLADRELLPEAWGGSVITVKCSASTGQGIPDLLEMLILQSEVLELKANPDARARGTVVESELHKGFGAIATVLVQNGTLRLGDALVIDEIYARVKTMHDEHGKSIPVAGPSTPVKITGLSGVPAAGNEFISVENEKIARKLASERASGTKRAVIQRRSEGLEGLMQRHQELTEKKVLNLIIRADVQGSVEALKSSLLNIKSKKVELNFIAEGVGEISESDVELAVASNAVIIGFHTQVESHAEDMIKREKVVIKRRNIIYQILDDVTELMLATLDKVRKETEAGTAEVKQVFKSSQLGLIAGCQVSDGIIKRNQFAKVIRKGEIVWEGNIASLKRVKEDVKEVAKGLECGILLEKFNDYQEGDEIKTFDITYIQQEL
ncbi:translation initiation factor IF-2 [Simkania negevensis]|uniref:Translation initiation factor IF-2 n=1 Tax=Simkania negevensis (strain ATCC VR-1471 / DSM 27360 / Z) TaxID=331113 RepID=F8L5K4_SIMNZ|nr:translation initiation factor IF-2 [Simkania negevensis]CCB89634.1 translation initiation factor IF-2 [Simkania negevensis Z]